MRTIDQTLKDRMNLALLTKANNADLRMEIEAVRPRTPIFHSRFWQESIITEDVTATSTSVAIQRETGRWGEKVFVAYISGGTLTVKSTDLVFPIANLVWTTVLTIPDCISCALEHDGNFNRGDFGRIEFHTTDLWLFYVTSAGALMGGILGESYDNLVASNVTTVDAVKGIESHYGDIDQGLMVFYLVSGALYYQQQIEGEWQGQESVSMAPANLVDMKCFRTFDFRVVLHVRDNAGKLYEMFTKMETSGWSGSEFISMTPTVTSQLLKVNYTDTQGREYITLTPSVLASLIYGLSPVPAAVENINDGNGDYGLKVQVAFDELVFDVPDNGLAFSLTDSDEYEWTSTAVEQTGAKTIVVTFPNFNNATGDLTISYTPGTMMGEVESVASFSTEFTPANLVPTAIPAPEPVGITNNDTLNIVVEFDKIITVLGSAAGFTVEYYEPEWVPGGENVLKSYTASAVDWLEGEAVSQTVVLGSGTLTDMEVV